MWIIFKVNDNDTSTTTHRSSVIIVNFEHISLLFLVFLLLNGNLHSARVYVLYPLIFLVYDLFLWLRILDIQIHLIHRLSLMLYLMFMMCSTAQKMKFSAKDFFSKREQIHRKLKIDSHLLKKPLIENFIFIVHCRLFKVKSHSRYLLVSILPHWN